MRIGEVGRGRGRGAGWPGDDAFGGLFAVGCCRDVRESARLFVLFLLGFNVCHDAGKRGGDVLLAGREMLADDLFGGGEALVEMQILDLLRQAAVDVVHGQAAGRGVFRLHNAEKVRIGRLGK